MRGGSVLGWCGLFAVSVLIAIGCGEKTPFPSDLPAPVYGGIDTNYVQVTPIWTSANGVDFRRPQDVYVGYDQTVYICDTDNDRVVQVDVDGSFLAEYPVVHPVSIAQDRGLDLLVVCGDHVVVHGSGDSVDSTKYGNAVFRRRFRSGSDFEKVWQADSPYHSVPIQGGVRWVDAAFYGIAASPFATKEYYLTDFWKGRIIAFTMDDQPAATYLQEGVGLGRTSFPTDLGVYTIAGQSYAALAQGAGNLGVQLFSLPNFTPLYSDADTLPALITFAARAYKDIAVDELSNFYLLLDSPDPLLNVHNYFYKFNRRGELLLSFGTLGSGERQFRNPTGIAYLEGVIYIADRDNNRIVRYQLATDARQ